MFGGGSFFRADMLLPRVTKAVLQSEPMTAERFINMLVSLGIEVVVGAVLLAALVILFRTIQ